MLFWLFLVYQWLQTSLLLPFVWVGAGLLQGVLNPPPRPSAFGVLRACVSGCLCFCLSHGGGLLLPGSWGVVGGSFLSSKSSLSLRQAPLLLGLGVEFLPDSAFLRQ